MKEFVSMKQDTVDRGRICSYVARRIVGTGRSLYLCSKTHRGQRKESVSMWPYITTGKTYENQEVQRTLSRH